ncbi:hypothetical protein V1478_002762 [Vespula squamosa]|uniref:Uncharacterized protein n=1 Tax=Vespula squamosa TaxID=30214 RepID=A0ABD2BSJ6_VESSQ
MKRMETRLESRKENLCNEHKLDVIEKSVGTIFFHIASMDDKLLQNVSSSNWCEYKMVEEELYNRILKLGVYDVVVIFTADNADRLEELGCKMPILKELKKEQYIHDPINKIYWKIIDREIVAYQDRPWYYSQLFLDTFTRKEERFNTMSCLKI